MTPKSTQRRLLPAVVTGAILPVLVGVFLQFSNFGDPLENLSYDALFLTRKTLRPEEVVVVTIDELSHKDLNQSFRSWDRRLHGQLVDQLHAAGASLIVFDMVFDEPSEDPAADEAFAAALRRSGPVALGGNVVEQGNFVSQQPPVATLRTNAQGWGHVDLPVDANFVVRKHPAYKDDVPGLAATAAQVVQLEGGLGQRPLWVNYYGPPGTLKMVSYRDVLHPETLPKDTFREKVVFVGARLAVGFAGENKDTFGTAYTWRSNQYAPGTEVQATIFLNYLRGDWLRRMPEWLELTWLVIFGAGIGALLVLVRVNWATLAAFGLAVLVFVIATLLFHQQIIWFWMMMWVQIAVALTWAVLYWALQSYANRAVLQSWLEAYLPKSQVKHILKDPQHRSLRAERQVISILFSDIADFSGLAERVVPDQLFAQLNLYFDHTLECVHRHDGAVIQLIGDAIFAIWNAPEPQANHQELACRAALQLRATLVSFNSEGTNLFKRTRVGLHCGEASVGNYGSKNRFVYSAIGAHVNLAARLEGLNKYMGTDTLASQAIVEPVREMFTWRPLGYFRLKGLENVCEVFELVSALEHGAISASWRAAFAVGLKHFCAGDFNAADATFLRVLEIKPHDGPTVFYRSEIEKLRRQPLPPNWAGEISMVEK